jgi:hypothetical protein
VVVVEVVVKGCLFVYVEYLQSVQVWALLWCCKIWIVVSIVPKEWACLLRCFAKFDKGLLLRKAFFCACVH